MTMPDEVKLTFFLLLGLTISPIGLAQTTATWKLDPSSSDWNSAANWSPETVPSNPLFGVSNTPSVVVTGFLTGVFPDLVFESGASPYTITARPGSSLVFWDAGITNNSGIVQNFFVGRDETGANGEFIWVSRATAGKNNVFGSSGGNVAGIQFQEDSDAGSSTFNNYGGTVPGDFGTTGFAGFYHHATGKDAVIHNFGGSVSGAAGGWTYFTDTSKAGTATITCHGSTIAGGLGGLTTFVEGARAREATLIATAGTNGGGGGQIQFQDSSSGETVRIAIFGNGGLDLSAHSVSGPTIGSLEGDGEVLLGQSRLGIGSNNLSTTFSGIIQESGSVTKIGIGTLTLTGANTYTGSTTITAGALKLSNSAGSGTGTGAVNVNTGTLGGGGIIAGPVIVGTGNGSGAFLAPSVGASQPTILNLQSSVTFKAGGTYTYKLNTKKARADRVMANGVTIESGAQFEFKAVANARLRRGTVFTALSNTAATPIAGEFANLPDDSTFTSGRNSFQVDYEDGDGNDLTLTVVP